MSSIVDIAYTLAEKAHTGQKRKYNDLDYISHPMAVKMEFEARCVDYVKEHLQPYSHINLLDCAYSACYLHDTLEDTELTVQGIYQAYEFKNPSTIIVDLVNNLTDTAKKLFPFCNRAERKAIDGYRMYSIENHQVLTHLIKMCDIRVNVWDFVLSDPAYAIKYIKEKQQYMQFLRYLPEQHRKDLVQYLELALRTAEAYAKAKLPTAA